MRTITKRRFCNFLFFTLLSIFPTISVSVDTLTATQSIVHNKSTLVSAGGVFELGFFNLDNPGEWYVGIWYNNIPQRTYVWVANRDNPLSNSSGIFKLEDRNLVLLDQGQNPVWSANISNGDNPVAQLLDSGNLVVREANRNNEANHYLWQSFDYPTDTLLPGMKLGWDLKTGFQRFLTAWKTTTDPSPGDFSFKLNYHGFPEPFLWNKQKIEYRSGPWNGLRYSGVPFMKPDLDFVKITFVTNQDEVSYSYSITKQNLYSRLTLSSTGILQRLTWIPDTEQWKQSWYGPRDPCDSYRRCGPYGICDNNAFCTCPKGFSPNDQEAWNLKDGSEGCVRKTDLDCSKDKFLHLPNMKLPESTTSYVDRNMNLKECEAFCSRNCSCTAYSNADIRNGGTGCVIWIGDLIDMRKYPADGGQDLFVRLAASDLDKSKNRTKTVIIIIAVILGILIITVSTYFFWRCLAKHRGKQITKVMQLVHARKTYQESAGDKIEDSAELPQLPLFDFEELATATENFHHTKKLGEGGFGPVYRGTLQDGREIAVKRLSRASGQGFEEFMNEVMVISKLQHRNLVRLLGCCVEAEEKMLVYEYMRNKSLDVFLFDPVKQGILDWRKRFNIIEGISRGLLYLHRDSRLRIIHRDLKASNILLDEELNPRISDFGMARIFGGNENQAKTTRVVGTYGYMSPEYAMEGRFSEKSDVFSYGVLLLEIVSGRRNSSFYDNENADSLLAYVWKLWNEDNILALLADIGLSDPCDRMEIIRCIHVGLLCVQEFAEDRPTISTILSMLNSEIVDLPPPKQPAFITRLIALGAKSSQTNINQRSTGTMTVTIVEGR